MKKKMWWKNWDKHVIHDVSGDVRKSVKLENTFNTKIMSYLIRIDVFKDIKKIMIYIIIFLFKNIYNFIYTFIFSCIYLLYKR